MRQEPNLRKLISLILLIISPSVFADWLHFSTTDEGDKHYVNVGSMQTKQHLVTLQFLTNFAKIESNVGRSNRVHQEFNCTNQQVRALSSSAHSEHFGGGQVLYSRDTVAEWMAVPPDTVLFEQFLIACR
ncbi:MAG: hypothetical protein EBW14_11785 [Oxalobacteraceae bacterium]|jgi:hypothetical protein|nr:hypothetical protein [Oxalobacteraceae bacterium]